MLANTSDKVIDDKNWIFESKYDGYRTVAVVNENNTELFSRNQLSFNKNFQAIADELKTMPHSVILDGEVVVEDDKGRSDFQLLQNYIKTHQGKLKYYVFDILNLDGNDTTNLKLLERKELLKMLMGNHSFDNIIYSEHIVEKGSQLFEEAKKQNWEGIMAKNGESLYKIGKRSNDWLKIKISKQEEALIIGITEPQNARNYFGSILLGQYDGDDLKFIGKCGTGFSENTLKDLYLKFKPLFIDKPPISKRISKEKVQWLKPKVIAQIKFTEWTDDDHLRHPVFLGLRIDKNPNEVQFSKNLNSEEMATIQKKEKKATTENDYDLKIGKINLHLTNQNKIYFPDDGITKGDVVDYYNAVSEFILPYLKDRPQSLNRFPGGINGPSFYQKDIDLGKSPNWLKTEKVFSDSNKEYIDYLICNDKATLLYMANLGCIEINPWNSTIKSIEKPDWIVMDLDPAKDDFKEVVRTALVVKQIMDELETDCFCKTSGASGLHIYIPLGAKYEYDTVKILAELLANQVVKRLPDTTTVERTISKRNGKLYVDFLQNRAGQTLASVYSVRPKPGATVSTPLEWSEVNEKQSPSQFTIKNILKRLEKKGDIWKPVLGKGADVEKMIKKITENPDF
ncbi:MAG: DNA ligase D [Bacteroidota bacterium]